MSSPQLARSPRHSRKRVGSVAGEPVPASTPTPTPAPAPVAESEAAPGDPPVCDQIAHLAYQLYLERVASGGSGSADDDWYRAERQFYATNP